MLILPLSSAFAAPTDLSELHAPSDPPELDGTEPQYGPPNARFQVVEFVDYGCAHCAVAANALPPLLSKHPGASLRVKWYPLSGQCNPAVSSKDHGDRCDAAYAAACAHQLGRFDEMSRWLFAEGDFARSALDVQARSLGLDPDAWAQCMDSPATRNVVAASARAGKKLGLDGTPSFYISGVVPGQWVRLTGGSVDTLDRVLTAAETGSLAPEAPAKPTPGP